MQPLYLCILKLKFCFFFSTEETLGLKASEGGFWHIRGRSATFSWSGMGTGIELDHQESCEDAFLLAFFS